MKISSIHFRLVSGGIALVLLPLVVIGILSIAKSSTALSEIARNQAVSISTDLAALADSALKEEKKLANVIAADQQVIDVLTLVNQGGAAGSAKQTEGLFQDFRQKFTKLGGTYQGIFVSDTEGNLITGVLEGDKEYKGSNIADQRCFQTAKATGQTTVGDINRSETINKLICIICVPVKSAQQEFVGTLGLVLKVEFLTEIISSRKLGKTGYGLMADAKGVVLAHPVQEHILKLDLSKQKGMERFVKRMLAGEKGLQEYTFKGIDKIAGFAPLSVANWYVVATQDSKEFFQAAHSIRNMSLIVISVAMLLTTVIVIYSAGLVVRPLNQAIASLKDIAQGEGDLTMRLDARAKDEIGELGHWFNTFVEKLQAIIKHIAENSTKVNVSSAQLSLIATELADGAEETSQRATTLATASEETSANLNNVAAAMEQYSTNTNMVSAAAEEMTHTINEIAQNAEQAREISGRAVDQAKSASERMEELGQAARKISKVTETITEISEQTNLLALNATIEAARAGEAGKGFAVVANEIKDLARQTAQATLNIKNQIDDVQRSTQSTVIEINQISEVISGVNEIVATIATAVEEQTAATREIADNIAQASMGIQEVNENVSQSSSVASDITKDITKVNLAATVISESSKQVKTNSEDLERTVSALNTIVASFKV